MGKGPASKSRRGTKRPSRYQLATTAPKEVDPKLIERYRSSRRAPQKRELFSQIKDQRKNAKRARRRERQTEQKTLGKAAPPPLVAKTIERLRKPDETIVTGDDDHEIIKDEIDDEFSGYYRDHVQPKLLITTGSHPSFRTKLFVKEARWLFPHAIYRPRREYTIDEITGYCSNRGFTDLLIITDRLKEPYNLILTHLPKGPTAVFRISNFLAHSQLNSPAERTGHYPELILKNFDTRLGRRISRMLGCLFPLDRDYAGRAVATFHNQRDYIFLRAHRYIFDNLEEVRIQELGPRFTLRLLALQAGVYDRKFGEYEWLRKKTSDQDKLRWFL